MSNQNNNTSSQVDGNSPRNATPVLEDKPRPDEAPYSRALRELRSEINRGWSGAVSKRNVKDIIKAKTEERNSTVMP